MDTIAHSREFIDSAITDLTASDAETRRRGAATLFQAGCNDASLVLAGWIRDEEFRQFVAGDGTGELKLTVGVAVAPDTFGQIREACGNPRLADVPPEQQAKEFELEFTGHVALDILTSSAPDGSAPLAGYLRKFGQGIQQVEMEVNSVDQATRVLQTKFGLKPAYEETRIGADGTRVNFFLVAASAGKKVLIELVEH